MVGAKIIVVDDDQDIRESLQVILEGRQYSNGNPIIFLTKRSRIADSQG